LTELAATFDDLPCAGHEVKTGFTGINGGQDFGHVDVIIRINL
jgi:hypothetical protein